MPHLSRTDTKLVIELLRAHCRVGAPSQTREMHLLLRLEKRMAQSAFTLGQLKTANPAAAAGGKSRNSGCERAGRDRQGARAPE